MILRLGFTGTQNGMTKNQKRSLVAKLKKWAETHSILEIHHGDCLGADEEFHNLCIKYWPHELKVRVHPPKNEYKRAFCQFDGDIIIFPSEEFLVRNHHIVDAVDQMLAAPKGEKEELRSGTWATVRYARKKEVEGRILKP